MKRLLILPLLLLLSACDKPVTEKGSQPPQPNMQFRQDPGYSGENAYLHCRNICQMGPRPTGSPAYSQQIDYLTLHLQEAGWQVVQRTFSLSNGARMTNLHAVMGTAADFDTRPIIITCHIDTKAGIGPNFVGADDGASAAAAMLELARTLKERKELGGQVELIFFDGEEAFAPRMSATDGLYGSRYEVMRRSHNMPRYQINLDMVGGRNKTIAVPVLDTGDEMLAEYEAAVLKLGYSTRKWTLYPGSYLDDHIPFAEAGVQSLNLICEFTGSSWWHTERDAMDRICPDSLRETGQMVLELLSRLVSKL